MQEQEQGLLLQSRVLQRYADVINGCYGPFGRSKLVIRDGKVPLISSKCCALIQPETKDPFSIFIASVQQRFHAANGDGTSSLLLVLNRAVLQINTAYGASTRRRRRLAHALGYFKAHLMQSCLLHPLYDRAIRVHIDDYKRYARKIIFSALVGVFNSPSVSAFLSDICADWIHQCATAAGCKSVQDYSTLIRKMKAGWNLLVFALPNASVDTSRLLVRDFMLRCSVSEKLLRCTRELQNRTTTRFIVCTDSMSLFGGENHIVLDCPHQTAVHTKRLEMAETFVQTLMNQLDVSLLVLTHGLDKKVAQICTRFSLSVIQYVDADAATALCQRARIQPVTSSVDRVSEIEIGQCASVKLVRVSGEVHALFTALSPHYADPLVQLILRAPTAGLQEQYVASLKNALTVIETWFHDSDGKNTLAMVPGGCASFFYLSWLCRKSPSGVTILNDDDLEDVLSILAHALVAAPNALLDTAASTCRERFIEHIAQVDQFYQKHNSSNKSLLSYSLNSCEINDEYAGRLLVLRGTGLTLDANCTDVLHPWAQIANTVETFVSTLYQICRIEF